MPTTRCITPVIGNGTHANPYGPLLRTEFPLVGWEDITGTTNSRFVRLGFMLGLITGTVAQLTNINADNRFLLPRGKTRAQVKTWLLNHISQAVADNMVDGRDDDGIEAAVIQYCRNV